MSEKVTIGLCVKDSERTIRQCVESILGQKYPNDLIQLVVVDGFSKDKTLSIINNETSKAHTQVETFSDQGQGLGTARQIVVNNAKGKYVIFVDADVILFDDFIRNHVEFMEKNPNVGVGFAKPMLQEGALVATVWDLATYAMGGSLGIGASICRSEVLRQVGGFDTKIKGASEDRDIIARFRLKGWLGSVNETARFFHKHRETVRSFWAEQSWFGYGEHYFVHKHGSDGVVLHKLPPGDFVFGLKLYSKTYKLTHRKLSLLILPLMILGNIGWWKGFAKGHKDRNGHE
jgi:glycosyltransferase involved in cell wall biosynthesis